MLNVITYVMSLAFVGGVAASALIAGAWVWASLTGTGSCVSKDRRVKEDDDVSVMAINFLIGGGIGVLAGLATAPENWLMAFPVGLAGFFVGLFNALRITRHLNNVYLSRAERLMTEGDFKSAIEDAREVARSSESLRSRAMAIVESAKQQRLETPMTNRMALASPGQATLNPDPSTDVPVGLSTASLWKG